MATDVADYTQAVNVTGGSVQITGTASVSIVGTPTVAISGTPTVNIGNTPSVNITSGSVTATISGTPNINITSQSVNLTTQTPWVARGTQVAVVGGSNFTTSAIPAGDTYMGIAVEAASLNQLQVTGGTTGMLYFPGGGAVPVTPYSIGGWIEFPINPALDATYRITYTSANGGGGFTIAAFSAPLTGLPSLQGQGPMAASLAVVIASDQSRVSVRTSPVDLSGTSSPAAGTVASVVLAAVGGRTYTCHSIDGTVAQSVAVSAAQELQLKDGATIVWQQWLVIPAVAFSFAHIEKSDLELKGTVGNSMTAAITNGVASVSETANIGAYFQ